MNAPAKPFSSYPEDRQKILDLCRKVEAGQNTDEAYELANLVSAILTDEAGAS